MNNDINIGFIGCGNIARNKHMVGLSKVEGVNLIAFTDANSQVAEACKKDFGAKNSAVYENAELLLKDKNIDAVHICTPNFTHAELSLMALDAGKHVMVEKPMAILADDAQKMVDKAEQNGLQLSVGHQSRFREDAQQLKRLIEAGSLGDIYYAKAHAIRRRGVPSWGVFLNKAIQGGGALIDIGCHALDLTMWLMDNYNPKVVVANTYQKLGKQTGLTNSWAPWDPAKFEVEDSAFGFITMENGATLTIEASWALNSLDTSNITAVLCGTKGGADMKDGLRINTDNCGCLQTIKPLESKNFEFPAKVVKTPGDLEMESWINALRTNTSPCVKARQTLQVCRVIDALYKSAETGMPVLL